MAAGWTHKQSHITRSRYVLKTAENPYRRLDKRSPGGVIASTVHVSSTHNLYNYRPCTQYSLSLGSDVPQLSLVTDEKSKWFMCLEKWRVFVCLFVYCVTGHWLPRANDDPCTWQTRAMPHRVSLDLEPRDLEPATSQRWKARGRFIKNGEGERVEICLIYTSLPSTSPSFLLPFLLQVLSLSHLSSYPLSQSSLFSSDSTAPLQFMGLWPLGFRPHKKLTCMFSWVEGTRVILFYF